jgi:GNAT superfamily N-acetyltransferase
VEPYVRVDVVVTFMRMDARPTEPVPPFPAGIEVRRMPACPVAMYRYLYNTVGADYVWWLRRALPDHQLSALLRDPAISIDVLVRRPEAAGADEEILGFFELDRGPWPMVNLSYFGLMPQAIGYGVGYVFLCHAIAAAWRLGAQAVTVNTCTADHRRALPNYLRAGFRVLRRLPENWDVPVRLGLTIPAHLRRA